MKLARTGLGLALGFLPLVSMAAGNLSYGQPGGETQQLLEFGSDAVRMSQQGQPLWMLYKDKDQTLYIVDDSKKSYQKVTQEAADALGKKVAAMQKQINDQLANLPPQQREMMKGMMPKMPDLMQAHEFRVEKDGAKRKVGEYDCQPYIVYDNDKPSQALCLASIKAVGISADDFALFKKMGQTMSSMASQFGAGSMAAVMDKIDGIPVEHRKPGAQSPQAVLLHAGSKAPDPKRLSVPAGYKERPLMPAGMPQ